jgi:hypothetical protein
MTLSLLVTETSVQGEHVEMTEGAECTEVQSAKLCQDLNAPHGRPVNHGLRGTELVDLIEWQMRVERADRDGLP